MFRKYFLSSRLWLIVLLSVLAIPVRSDFPPRLYSVDLSASVSVSPPRIALTWNSDSDAASYTVSRKTAAETSWTPLATLSGSATAWTDLNVSVGAAFEYQVIKNAPVGYTGSGYVYAGVNAPAIENRGRVLLLVDSTWSAKLAAELSRFEQDLVGDGWAVARQDVPRSATPPQVRATVQSLYSADPVNTRSLILFGHIAVPYSGGFYPDDHANHSGAWPADVYYGDVDGSWTDSTITDLNSEKSWNHNVPGDGKFDQSDLPSDVELQIGRIDLNNMTCFANKTPARNEETLLRQYLNKDHNFRHGLLPLPRRGLVCDNFYPDEEALPTTGWRNFAPLFGAANNVEVPGGSFVSTLSSQGYLFSYADGGGNWYTCNGVGSSDDFALNDLKTVFTFFFGSYFGDWDNESNFLRAPLGSTSYILTSAWGGRPHWFIHHMGLGETIGYSTRLSQNNAGLYQPVNIGSRQVHVALMGDPTLRLHPVIPPASPTATQSGGITLQWQPSSDSALLGYYVYRAASEAGPYNRLSSAPVTGTSFVDSAGQPSSIYMVRAVKLESTPSGTYTNLSQGVFARATVPPPTPGNFSGVFSAGAVNLSWTASSEASGYYVYRKLSGTASWGLLATINTAATTSYTDTAVSQNNTYNYSLAAFSNSGVSAQTPPVTVTVPGAARSSTTLIGTDLVTKGSWKNVYGSLGYNVISDTASYPAGVSVMTTGNSEWVWDWSATDPAALLRTSDSTRLAACWYSFGTMDVHLAFSDAQTRRVSFYWLDWDNAGRKQNLDFYDTDTGELLSHFDLANFTQGLYTTWDIQGRVTARISPKAGFSGNAVLSGMFFDSPVPTVVAPAFAPAGGTYSNSVSVTISSSTPGATIRYTTDGSTPGGTSTIYSGALQFTNNTTLKARAFKSGMNDSAISTAAYTILRPGGPAGASVTFNGLNTTRGGTWKGSVGTAGALVIADAQRLPPWATLSASGKSDWTWEYSTAETRALERDSVNSRLAACWYAATSFDLDLNVTDSVARRVSFYCVDWDRGGRQQKVEIVDFSSGQVLHSQTLANFSQGAWLDYSIRGRVIVRFTKVASYNAVVSGVFFE